ncbi:peptidyl-prolyl cis-trans isomerase [Roseobacter sinensis]|uniref:SurA N-terminal domain-containing protein n=1 Tax=Roseobacter sinensis TaxID=2931391 RepID=A0ABT3BFQ3_9RHOB|nr:peptidyl-prolyl cis-trans isomerase [Roseobacter sp. WL0113]MCV3272383.1 SurA N-terminal domain-containing protein [Roseobacter sp. WL0113]
MAKGSSSISKTAVWVLLGLLIIALGGFGATNLTGNIRSIGTVGDMPVSVDNYARQLQQEIQAVQQQTGQILPFAQAQAIGLDRAVLQRIVAQRALDHEAAQIGLSIGDENLRDRILEIPAFRGVDGSFDREGYRFALEQNGISESQFETQLREEVSRTLMQGAIISGVVMPEAYADTLINYVAERRSFTWARLDEADLAEPIAEPDAATLRAHYDANIDDFTLPETKQITYALLSPDAMVDQVEISETDLREAYELRDAEFNQPERRLVERLAYLDEDSAAAAAARIAEGEAFEALVTERGLDLADIDLGDVTEANLGEAGAEVFAASVGDVVGPLPSSLGPALFRVNAVLPAQFVPFEEAEAILRPEVAADRARRLVEAQAESLDDLLAGGATLEELATDTDMVLAQVDWTSESTENIAAYEAFRRAAQAVSADDFPEIAQLEDGGLFALRLDAVLPPRPAPFEDVRDAVLEHWRAAETEARLTAQVEAQLPQLSDGAEFAQVGMDAMREDGLLRSDFVGGTPANFMAEVFTMSAGDVSVLPEDGALVVVRLDAIEAPQEDEDTTALRTQLTGQANQALAQDLFEIYGADVVLRANPQINPQALQAVHVNFP